MWDDDDRSALERSGLVALAVLAAAAVVAGLLAVAMALSLPAASDEVAPRGDRERPAECVTLDMLAAAAGGQAELRTIDGAPAVAFMAAYNAFPPPSDERADRILVALWPEAPWVGIAFERDGCVRRSGRIGRGTWEAVLRAAFGEGSS